MVLAAVIWLALGAAATPKLLRELLNEGAVDLFHAFLICFLLVGVLLMGPLGLLVAYGDTIVYRPKPPKREGVE